MSACMPEGKQHGLNLENIEKVFAGEEKEHRSKVGVCNNQLLR